MNETAHDQDRTIITSVTLYPRDLALARQVAEAAGSRSLSAGIRAIFAEYRRLKEQPAPSHGN